MPMLMMPKRGKRNEKKMSWEPRRRSFFVKSIAASVELLSLLREVGSYGSEEAFAYATAKTVRAKKRQGIERRMHLSMLSEKLMKMPALVRVVFQRQACTQLTSIVVSRELFAKHKRNDQQWKSCKDRSIPHP